MGEDGALPSEFRIFHAGLNTTEKGDFVFDDAAAKLVMADVQRRAVRTMIDLEHLSLDSESKSFDPDARGSCRLEVRPDGSLWAVDVKWTPDGAQRLSERRQSYISPVVDFDRETGRVLSIHNLALTAIPATHGAQQLVAASKRRVAMAADGTDSEGGMEQVYSALGLDASASLLDVVGAIGKLKSALNGGEPDGDEGEDDDGDELDDAEMSAAGATPPPKPGATAAPADQKAAMTARKAARKKLAIVRRTAHRDLLAKTGEKTTLGALSKVETWRSAYMTLEADREKLAKEKVALELTERREHITQWVKLGKEDPATAFDQTSADQVKPLLEPWASMPLEKIRERSAKLKIATPTATSIARPPATQPRSSNPSSDISAQPIPDVNDPKVVESLKRQGIDIETAKLKFTDPEKYRDALRMKRGRHTRGQLEQLAARN